MEENQEPPYYKALQLRKDLFAALREAVALRCTVSFSGDLPEPIMIGEPPDDDVRATMLAYKAEHGIDDDLWEYLLSLLSYSSQQHEDMWQEIITSNINRVSWNARMRGKLQKIRLGWLFPESEDTELRKQIAAALISQRSHAIVRRIIQNELDDRAEEDDHE